MHHVIIKIETFPLQPDPILLILLQQPPLQHPQ